MKTRQITERHIVRDDNGNTLTADHMKTRVRISLKLTTYKRKRDLGYIDKKTRTLHVKRNRDRHLHYKANAYGFNYLLIANASLFDTVVICDDFGRYRVPRKSIIEEGRFLYFLARGFEKQIFYPIDKLKPYPKRRTRAN